MRRDARDLSLEGAKRRRTAGDGARMGRPGCTSSARRCPEVSGRDFDIHGGVDLIFPHTKMRYAERGRDGEDLRQLLLHGDT